MKIECPNCHLSGKMNDHEIPAEGRRINCPKCRTDFHVKKEAGAAASSHMMNICPNCQYSTFTEEMFAVCPKCGMDGNGYQEMLHKQQEREQLRRDEEALHRNFAQHVVMPEPTQQPEVESPAVPTPVTVAGWICVSVAMVILIYGGVGLYAYYSKDWQAILAETSEEPVTKAGIFFSYGLLPWLRVIYGMLALVASVQFLNLRLWARKGLEFAAWMGATFMVGNELVEFIAWVTHTSSTPTIGYYAVGVLNVLLMTALWAVPPAFLIRFLRGREICKIFSAR